SLDRNAFVAARDLKTGERVWSARGPGKIAAVQANADTHRVYNLEVHRTHVYLVSSSGILVHNSSPGNTPISMDNAIEAAINHASSGGPGMVMETTGRGTNYQFRSTFTDANNQTVSLIGRLDVNPTDPHVQQLGPHLNLETQINGRTIRTGPQADPHT